MSDIEKAFSFLHDNIPSWFKDMAGIEENLVRLQAEMAKIPSKVAPVKKRTGSIESIRDTDDIVGGPGSSAAPQTCLFSARKRKTSISSAHASAPGPVKSRPRAMIIVIYDGEIQKAFEKLVRAIGTGRNMLRKAKMAAKMEELAALAGPDDDSEDDSGDDPVMAKIGYRHRPGLTSMRSRGMMRGTFGNNTNSITSSELFDTTDKALELAQSLCERAAHQSLRDGDCKKELEGVKKHFETVLDTANKEHAKHLSQKPKEEPQEEAEIEVAPKPLGLAAKPLHPAALPSPAAISASKGIDIEVDDDEDDDMDFVMPPVRLTSRAR